MNIQNPRTSGATNMQSKHTADATTVEEGLAIAAEQDAIYNDEMATETAMQNTLLTPRFYTTDFDELDAIDVSSVREDWDGLIAQMLSDPNKGHFKKNEDWDHIDWDGMEPQLKKGVHRLPDLKSCTAEFSGCVLYKEMKRRGNNKDITQLFQLMARDEARHAGFINDALREAGIRVNLGFLTQKKKYTYFRPKFIYYATYLSKRSAMPATSPSSGTWRRTREHRFHPIFKWFREWCNDEFSHGEAFALLMKTDPKADLGRQCAVDQVLPDRRLCDHVSCATTSARPSMRHWASIPIGMRQEVFTQDLRDLEADLPYHAGYRPPAVGATGSRGVGSGQYATWPK